jgi:hypothetical protein
MTTTKNIEMDLPKDSVIRKIFESAAAQPSHLEEGVQQTFNAPNGVKEIETGLDDKTYDRLITAFLNKARLEASPKAKLEKKIQVKEDERKPLKFRKGFLNGPRVSHG